MREKKKKVESLLALYQQVENSGHRELNQIRGVATSLKWKWAQFYSSVEQRRKNLQLSLHFQENLFEVMLLVLGYMYIVCIYYEKIYI